MNTPKGLKLISTRASIVHFVPIRQPKRWHVAFHYHKATRNWSFTVSDSQNADRVVCRTDDQTLTTARLLVQNVIDNFRRHGGK